MPRWFYQLALPQYFYILTQAWVPWFIGITTLFFILGLSWGLFIAPTDAQQGEAFRIIYVHVPAAFMSLGVYVFVAINAFIYWVWRIKTADILACSAASIGAWFTAITLITGMLWGKPMWGAWWVWDPRLTFELILLFCYFGYIALRNAIDDPQRAAQISGLWIMIGIVNIPIIHYSVEWWNSIHQGSTINLFGKSTIYSSMYYPLILMILAYAFYFISMTLIKARTLCLEREQTRSWVKQLWK